MQIILDEKYSCERSVVALGMFDGVHLGHRVLLERGAALARQRKAPLVVCTFQTHPLAVIAPDHCPPSLTTFAERCALMEALGVDVLCAMPFTPETMNMLPEEYVGQLVRRFHPTDVVCGYNHTFGRKGQGTPALLNALGAALGFTTSIVPKITLEHADVSSTVIRGLLRKGDVVDARAMLKRPYKLTAMVEGQDGEGRCALCLTDEGKQRVASGSYRAVLQQGEHRWPIQLHTSEGDHMLCHLPCELQVGEPVALFFWTNLSIDF